MKLPPDMVSVHTILSSYLPDYIRKRNPSNLRDIGLDSTNKTTKAIESDRRRRSIPAFLRSFDSCFTPEL